MTRKVNADVYREYIDLLKQVKIANANYISKILKVKFDTAKSILIKMVDDGIAFYEDIKGQGRCYSLAPNWNELIASSRHIKIVPKSERKDDGDARTSSMVIRARTVDDIRMIPGFVCHPNTKGNSVPKLKFIRSHINGEYQVSIEHVGDMRTNQWVEKTRIRWTRSKLNNNVACNGSIFTPDDADSYKIRTVSTKDGCFNLLSIKVHPRYIYYENEENTYVEECKQQVYDILSILERVGWRFGTDVTVKGEKHTAYAGSEVLASHFSEGYDRHTDDDLYCDKSHGTGEVEHIGSDKETDYIMANLPTVIKNQTQAIYQLTEQIAQLTVNQANTIKLLLGAQSTNFKNEGGMYG